MKSVGTLLKSALALGALSCATQAISACIELPTNCPISSAYGYRIHPVTKERTPKLHGGIDFACPMYTPVKNSAAGKVVGNRWSNIGGNMLFVQSGEYQIGYLHNEQVIAQTGAQVPVGQVVSKVGNTGASTGPHLHFQVKNGSMKAIDPMPLFCSKPTLRPGVLQGDTNPPDSEPTPPEMVSGDQPPPSSGAIMNDHLGLEGGLRQILADAVGQRAFNPDYQRQISTLDETRLYAEIAYMGTLRMRLQQESAQARERMLATSAMLHVLRAEQVLRPQLDAQRDAAGRAAKQSTRTRFP